MVFAQLVTTALVELLTLFPVQLEHIKMKRVILMLPQD